MTEQNDRASLPRLMDITSLAEHLSVNPRHINPRHIRRLVAEPRVPYAKWGHLIRFAPAEIAAWIDEVRRPTAAG